MARQGDKSWTKSHFLKSLRALHSQQQEVQGLAAGIRARPFKEIQPDSSPKQFRCAEEASFTFNIISAEICKLFFKHSISMCKAAYGRSNFFANCQLGRKRHRCPRFLSVTLPIRTTFHLLWDLTGPIEQREGFQQLQQQTLMSCAHKLQSALTHVCRAHP